MGNPSDMIRETGRVGADAATTAQSVRSDEPAAVTAKPPVWEKGAAAGTWDERGDVWEDEEEEQATARADGHALR